MQANEEQLGLRSDDDGANIGLISAHVSGRLNGLVAQIKVRQVYKNWTDANIECVYTFPLAWQSVLLGMSVELNGKRLSGLVKPKKVAETEYEEAIDSGDLPVMLERAGKDLYTANIGNIQSGDEVVIELDYAQILKAEDGAIRFNLPTTIAPRYGEAEDAGLRLHQMAGPDAQAEHRLFLSLELSRSLCDGMIYSPTHEIQTNRQGEQCSVRLVGGAWLDRDFVLVIDRIGDLNFALAAKDPMQADEVTLLTGSVYRPQKAQARRPVAVKVLVDCSGSMHGDSIEQAKDCLEWLVGQLSSSDTMSLTRFGSSVEHEHPALQQCTSIYKQDLKSSIRKLNADLGGTEIEDALKQVVALDKSAKLEESSPVILLITDGEVWDIENAIAAVSASGHRIFAVGVGSSPAESLLKDMAEVTGGACEMVTPRENMQKAAERLLIRLRQTEQVEQTLSASAKKLWNSASVQHAYPGEGLTWWHQLSTTSPENLEIGLSSTGQKASLPCPVVWDESIELSRIAAAIRLRTTLEPKAREALAVQYQLVTSETNLILVHERAESEKAHDLPELHQVRPMLAAGWSGNGSTRSRPAPALMMLRTGSDNVPFIAESRGLKMSSNPLPAVWRTSRSHAGARIDGMSSSGMDDIEIPAFLRKTAESQPTARIQNAIDWVKEKVSPGSKQDKPETAPPQKQDAAPKSSASRAQAPKPSASDLIAALRTSPGQDHPVRLLLSDFNLACLGHNQFRTALAVCLKTHQANYLQWLVLKHMKAAGSAAPVWAVFIAWAADAFAIELDRHAQRLLRDFLKSVQPTVQEGVRADLDGLLQGQI